MWCVHNKAHSLCSEHVCSWVNYYDQKEQVDTRHHAQPRTTLPFSNIRNLPEANTSKWYSHKPNIHSPPPFQNSNLKGENGLDPFLKVSPQHDLRISRYLSTGLGMKYISSLQCRPPLAFIWVPKLNFYSPMFFPLTAKFQSPPYYCGNTKAAFKCLRVYLERSET